jgi:hypothetical protein
MNLRHAITANTEARRALTVQLDAAAHTVAGPAPVCVACVGDGTDPATGRPCLRCKGTGIDPDPAAPTGIIVGGAR